MSLGFTLPTITLVLKGHIHGVFFVRKRVKLVVALRTGEGVCAILEGRVADEFIGLVLVTALLLHSELVRQLCLLTLLLGMF